MLLAFPGDQFAQVAQLRRLALAGGQLDQGGFGQAPGVQNLLGLFAVGCGDMGFAIGLLQDDVLV
ncbi:hypothetical protein D3C75_940150 [compost metagenome]